MPVQEIRIGGRRENTFSARTLAVPSSAGKIRATIRCFGPAQDRLYSLI